MFLPISSHKNFLLNKFYYDKQREWTRTNSYASTAQAIKAPFTFFYIRDNDWSDNHSYQFWNKNFTSDPSITNTITLKTIYSPSSSGYVEPKTAAFTGFTSSGGDATSYNQYNMVTLIKAGTSTLLGGKLVPHYFFPALGYRET